MKALTDIIRFKSEKLDEIITIQEWEGIWGFESTSGYNTFGSVDYNSFNEAYNQAKKYEKKSIDEKALEEKYYNEKSLGL